MGRRSGTCRHQKSLNACIANSRRYFETIEANATGKNDFAAGTKADFDPPLRRVPSDKCSAASPSS